MRKLCVRGGFLNSLAHKIELNPTNKQKTYFKKACGISRFTWNWALANWNEQYKQKKSPISGMSLKKDFNKIKRDEYPWIYEVTKYAAQQPFIQLNHAYKRFFKGIANKPKFKKKGRCKDSFYVGGDQIKVKGKKVWIPNLGLVRLKEHLRFKGKIRSATFSRTADRWFVAIQVDTEIDKISPIRDSVGVDLGINTMAQLSSGVSVKSPKALKTNLRKLKKVQRQLKKKKFNSSNYVKRKLKVQKLHYKISNIRKDNLHKLTTHIIRSHKRISIEDLNVRGMLKNHKLARDISDIGFYEIRRQLEYKSKIHGNVLYVADRFFASSKKCSSCGIKNEKLTLKDRLFRCECGFEMDRDLNASINLEQVMTNKLRGATSEVTPMEMTAMDLWKLSTKTTSIVELGNKHQILFA